MEFFGGVGRPDPPIPLGKGAPELFPKSLFKGELELFSKSPFLRGIRGIGCCDNNESISNVVYFVIEVVLSVGLQSGSFWLSDVFLSSS